MKRTERPDRLARPRTHAERLALRETADWCAAIIFGCDRLPGRIRYTDHPRSWHGQAEAVRARRVRRSA